MSGRLRAYLILSSQILTLLVIAASPGTAGGGAPQALALVSTDQPIEVTCDRGGCRVRLSSFCLERNRDAPESGQAYRLAAGDLALVVEDQTATRRVSLPAGAVLTADRGHRSVTLRLTPGNAARWSGAKFAIEIGPMTTLLPVADGTGPGGHDAAQVEAVTGSLRAVGQRVVEGAVSKIAVVRLLNQVVNRLPVVVSRRGEGSEVTWRQVLAEAPKGAGTQHAAEVFEACYQSTQLGRFYNIRNCLILRHDRLMEGLNEAYWEALTGS